MIEYVTVGLPEGNDWVAVNDAGQRRRLPRSALDSTIRHLRAGQRLRARVSAGVVTQAEVP